MREAGRKAGPHGNDPVVVERRIQISRLIAGYSGEVEDTTPKEALLLGMWHNLQAYRDWLDVIEELSQRPPTPENTALCEHAEREAERLLDKMGEFAFKVAGYIHPKLQATNIIGQTGANQTAILQLLMEEMDERERNAPIPIEYKPIKTGG
jgi:hypothetical protein